MDSHKLSVAPMLDCTNSHFRRLVRLVSRRVHLWTEMVHQDAVIHAHEHPHARASARKNPRESIRARASARVHPPARVHARACIHTAVALVRGAGVLACGGRTRRGRVLTAM